jgi:outer membrane beta-barrel protein
MKKSIKKLAEMTAFLVFSAVTVAPMAYSDDTTPPPTQTPTARLPVDKMKEKYWNKGNEDMEVRVVQNRLYSKAHTFELGLFVGSIATDPFLSVKNYGASLGYHLSDYFGIVLLGWKDSVQPSSALTLLQGPPTNTTANTNDPNYFIGGELDFVPLYGKLSLVGKSIIYFDTHLDLGCGDTSTETGKYITPFVGIGEQIYLNGWSSLMLDYRLAGYHEQLVQKTAGPGQGSVLGGRTTLNDVITVGVSFFGHII